MELRDLRYFATVAGEGSFVRAAAKLHISQPALSRQIRDFEREVGARLLIRGPRGVSLTPAGANVLPTCQLLLDRVQAALERAHLAHAGVIGTLQVGIGRLPILSELVARGFGIIRDSYPGIVVDATEILLPAQIGALRSRAVDLGIAAEPGPHIPGLVREALYDDPITLAIIPAAHPAATASQLTVEQLADLPLLLPRFPAVSHLRGPVEHALSALGARQPTFVEALDSLYGLVSIGRGWSLGATSQRANPPEGTVAIPIAGLSIPFPVAMFWLEENKSPVLRNVVDAFRRARDGDHTAEPTIGVQHDGQLRERLDVEARSIELRHFEALVAAIEEGSFVRAAQRLGLTQPGMSRRIDELERALDVELLERNARGVEATAAGETLRGDSAGILLLATEIGLQARRSERGVRGKCVLGVVPPAVARGLVAHLLERLAATFPDVQVNVVEIPTPHQPTALLEHEIDLAIGHAYPGLISSPSITGVRLVDDAIDGALLSRIHPLAAHESIKAEALREVPLLFMPREFHPAFYDSVMEALGRIGLQPLVEGTFDGLRTVWSLSAQGMGWSLGTRSQRRRAPPNLVCVPVEGLYIPWGLELLWRVDESSDAVQAALWILRDFRAAIDGHPVVDEGDATEAIGTAAAAK
jgi:DNA-binding transcriptional LysR family regulator